MAKTIHENGFKITIKNVAEISSMRKSGKILATVLQEIKSIAKPGISLLQLDNIAESIILKHNALPSFKGYNGFPATICTNINSQVVHGIPTDYKLQTNDLVTIDCGVIVNNLHTDSAITFYLGTPTPEIELFINTAYLALEKGIQKAIPNNRITDISKAIQTTIESQNYTICDNLVGHGIGYELHEDPYVPNFFDPDNDVKLQEGMTLAIEPIFMMGDKKTKLAKDGWTIETKDNSLAIQVEHTILITAKTPEILTQI